MGMYYTFTVQLSKPLQNSIVMNAPVFTNGWPQTAIVNMSELRRALFNGSKSVEE
jgi:hypothetical protein